MSSTELRVLTLELGPFQAHCLLLSAGAGREAIVVDPGFEAETVVATIAEAGLRPTAIVLTHAHVDHACGVAAVKRAYPEAKLLLHPAEVPLYRAMGEQAAMFSIPAPPVVPEDGLLSDAQVLVVGGERLVVRHTPGHSPGHVVLLHEHPLAPLAIVGDLLFAGGVGRTDLWGGSFAALEKSIRTVLYTLPAHTRVIPGHGDETTVGVERETNPFVAGEEP